MPRVCSTRTTAPASADIITNFHDLAPLTVFCEAGQPSVCEPNMVVRPLGLSKRWPVPYVPLAQFAAKPPFTFNPWKHHMDLGEAAPTMHSLSK